MRDWDEFDEEAAREGAAIKGSFKARYSKKQSHANKNNAPIKTDHNLLQKLNVIDGKAKNG